ncbi:MULTISPECIES: hypothetical protein [Bacillota]|uniref:hypothetical protein n=1 Tax=Bacillota TaxID=1239 RepID=UPI002570124B|nr:MULTISPECIES: hypothetical protein [Bacillota]
MFFNKNKEINTRLAYIDGISFYTKGFMIKISIDDNNKCLIINPLVEKKESVKVKLQNIINVSVVTDKDIVEKSKSVLGRAAIGGLLIGPLGAIVGGISGTGNKVKNKYTYYMVINYKSEIDNEIKVISFKIVDGSLKWSKFFDELKSRINKNENLEEVIPEYL